MLEVDPDSTSFWLTLCAVASEVAGEKLEKSDFEPDKLDQHLKLQIAVVDEKGKVTKTTRDVSTLRTTLTPEHTTPSQIGSFKLKEQPW